MFALGRRVMDIRILLTVSVITVLAALWMIWGQSNAPVVKVASKPLGRIDLTRIPKGLSFDDSMRFIMGRSFFSDPWVAAGAATTLRDGLGPMFNARACIGCHARGGRSAIPSNPERLAGGLALKLTDASGTRADPNYGDQLQFHGLHKVHSGRGGKVTGEGHLFVRFENLSGQFADGSTYVLKKPVYQVRDLQFGPLASEPRVALIAPSLQYMQLIERVSDASILKNADAFDRNQDGISGRVNRISTEDSATKEAGRIGRFGLKANHPDLLTQVASALRNDIGITNALFQTETCTGVQAKCGTARSGAGPVGQFEISESLLTDIVYFVGQIGLPGHRRDPVASKRSGVGAELFASVGCSSCHVSQLRTRDDSPAALYSDLLLHDMGKGLSDGRHVFSAGASEWRTAPLAGIKYRARISPRENYLHDGRAATIEEAILWHGGEAGAAQQAYQALSKKQRLALTRFVGSR